MHTESSNTNNSCAHLHQIMIFHFLWLRVNQNHVLSKYPNASVYECPIHGFKFMVPMSILVGHVHIPKAIPEVPSHSEGILYVSALSIAGDVLTLLNLKLSGGCNKALQNRLRS